MATKVHPKQITGISSTSLDLDIQSIRSEIQTARNGETNLSARLSKILLETVQDFKITQVSNDVTNSRLVVSVNAGSASINNVIVNTVDTTFNIQNPTTNRTYYVFLNADGTFSTGGSSTESNTNMLIAKVIVGSSLTELSYTDERYFFTRGGGNPEEVTNARTNASNTTYTNLKTRLDAMDSATTTNKNDIDTIENHLTGVGNDISAIQSNISSLENSLDTLDGTVSDIETEINNASAGYATLDARLDDIQSTVGSIDGNSLSDFNISSPTSGQFLSYNGTKWVNVNSPTESLGTASTKNTGTSAGNVPVLDSSGKLSTSILPAIAISDTFVVSSQSAMLAVTAETGDVAIRTDLKKTFILKQSPANVLANWEEMLTPTDAVSSVNGQTGTVVLDAEDVGAEPTIATKGTAFNKSFGTTAGTVAEGNHKHSVSDITGLQEELDSITTNLGGLTDVTITTPASGEILSYNGTEWVNTTHSHTFNSLTSKPTTLSGYGITDAASLTHTHVISDVTNLQSTLDGKSNTNHTHTFASLTSKPTTLSGYGITDAASATHTHTFSSLTSKPTSLSGYGITDAYTKTEIDTTNQSVQTSLAGKQATITGAASSVTTSNLTTSKVLVSDSSGKIAANSLDSSKLANLENVTSDIQTQIDGKQATITGAATTITGSNLTASRTLVSDASGKVSASTVDTTKLGYLGNVTSDIQAQLDTKQGGVTGAGTTIISSDLTADRAVISNSSGKIAVSPVTSTELGYVSGVTSSIQTQLNNKANSSDISTVQNSVTTMQAQLSNFFTNVSDGFDDAGKIDNSSFSTGNITRITAGNDTYIRANRQNNIPISSDLSLDDDEALTTNIKFTSGIASINNPTNIQNLSGTYTSKWYTTSSTTQVQLSGDVGLGSNKSITHVTASVFGNEQTVTVSGMVADHCNFTTKWCTYGNRRWYVYQQRSTGKVFAWAEDASGNVTISHREIIEASSTFSSVSISTIVSSIGNQKFLAVETDTQGNLWVVTQRYLTSAVSSSLRMVVYRYNVSTSTTALVESVFYNNYLFGLALYLDTQPAIPRIHVVYAQGGTGTQLKIYIAPVDSTAPSLQTTTLVVSASWASPVSYNIVKVSSTENALIQSYNNNSAGTRAFRYSINVSSGYGQVTKNYVTISSSSNGVTTAFLDSVNSRIMVINILGGGQTMTIATLPTTFSVAADYSIISSNTLTWAGSAMTVDTESCADSFFDGTHIHFLYSDNSTTNSSLYYSKIRISDGSIQDADGGVFNQQLLATYNDLVNDKYPKLDYYNNIITAYYSKEVTAGTSYSQTKVVFGSNSSKAKIEGQLGTSGTWTTIYDDNVTPVVNNLGSPMTLNASAQTQFRYRVTLTPPNASAASPTFSSVSGGWGIFIPASTSTALTGTFLSSSLINDRTVSKVKLTANQTLNGGTIRWQLSNDGGANFYPTIGTEYSITAFNGTNRTITVSPTPSGLTAGQKLYITINGQATPSEVTIANISTNVITLSSPATPASSWVSACTTQDYILGTDLTFPNVGGDLRVKATVRVPSGSNNSPIISDYLIVSSNSVLQSDLVPIQINLMKMGVQMGTWLASQRTGFRRMMIDAFNDTVGVTNSGLTYSSSLKTYTGTGTLTSVAESTDDNIFPTQIVVVDDVNTISGIVWEVKRNAGSWETVTPNQVYVFQTGTSQATNQIQVRATLSGQTLTGWAYCYN